MKHKPLPAPPPPASGHEVDLFRFAASGEQASGQCSVALLPRLGAESLNLDAQVTWRAHGERKAVPHQTDAQGAPVQREFLLLAAKTQLLRSCDRCGQPVSVPLEVDSRLEIFATEGEADEAPLDDESADPIVGSKKFSLLQQVEEELLLAIPPFVTHSECKVAQEDTTDAKPNPFSKLAALKAGREGKK
jgi:uncharacterized protein